MAGWKGDGGYEGRGLVRLLDAMFGGHVGEPGTGPTDDLGRPVEAPTQPVPTGGNPRFGIRDAMRARPFRPGSNVTTDDIADQSVNRRIQQAGNAYGGGYDDSTSAQDRVMTASTPPVGRKPIPQGGASAGNAAPTARPAQAPQRQDQGGGGSVYDEIGGGSLGDAVAYFMGKGMSRDQAVSTAKSAGFARGGSVNKFADGGMMGITGNTGFVPQAQGGSPVPPVPTMQPPVAPMQPPVSPAKPTNMFDNLRQRQAQNVRRAAPKAPAAAPAAPVADPRDAKKFARGGGVPNPNISIGMETAVRGMKPSKAAAKAPKINTKTLSPGAQVKPVAPKGLGGIGIAPPKPKVKAAKGGAVKKAMPMAKCAKGGVPPKTKAPAPKPKGKR